jgi:hypothetical protein
LAVDQNHPKVLAREVNMAFGQTWGFDQLSWGGATLAPGYGEMRPLAKKIYDQLRY